ncbi:MAG: TRAP transporter small permease [Bradymonadales bacterium]|nr:TRAP transporter small permease [Bradymonadales bacterium]
MTENPRRSWFDVFLRVLNYISVLAILFTAAWIFTDVVGRFFFGSPVPGTTELIKSVLLAIVFLGVPLTLRRNAHIRTTVLVRRFSRKAKIAVSVIGSALGAVIFALVCVYGWEAAVRAWQVHEFEGVQLRVPTYPSRFIMVLGSALLVIQYLINIARAFGRSEEATDGGAPT